MERKAPVNAGYSQDALTSSDNLPLMFSTMRGVLAISLNGLGSSAFTAIPLALAGS